MQSPNPSLPIVPSIPFSVIKYPIIAVAGLLTYGIIGSLLIMHLDIINATYFTIITTATVGYGDISPQTPLQKFFVVTLVLGGASLIAYAFTLIIMVVSMTVEDITSGARHRRMIRSVKNHFVLCGYGRVGSAVHKELLKRNYKVIIVEKDPAIVEKELWDDSNILAIPGDATDENVMREAGIERARGVIITTGDDVDNLFITLTAREIHPDIWIVTRASKKVNIKRLYRSGANQVISPESSGAEDIYFAAIQPTIMKITEMHDVADIRRESEIILKHGCTLENIEYHLPEFKEPLARKIGITEIEQLNRFLGSLEKDPHRKKSLERIYESVSGIHSHWISGPDKETLEKVADELKKEGFLLGVDLSEDEIKEVAHKYGRLVEVVIKPEIRITEIHDVRDIQAEAEIILKNGCVLEDIEYYLQGFHEPLKRKIHLQDISEMERFLKRLSEDSARMDALERLYTLSGGGIHSHRITGPDTKSLAQVEKELKKKGFLLGVNLSEEEIFEKIKEYGRVSEMLLHHAPGSIDDKTIILKHGGRILDSKHYLPGLEQVVTRKLYLKDYDDLKRCEEEYKKPDARRSLDTLSQISRNIHSHTVSAGDVKTIKKIIKALDESGQLLGVDLPEKEIWTIVENAEPAGFCVE
ncbi:MULTISPECIES: 3H domain-containing protein [Methanobacterium]|uniref:NAD-binding protein n=1 Tax=Methanobacterium formicicum TaxID=2162 RepID=A0A090JVC8_METFO|nr:MULTISPECIES: 3H domain-containing protein [Methanobacterium]AIS32963.1 potassium channel protein [Methanobacterium formicicum]MBF4474832.1 NAD-binding protein [Methanobacterium formicicum]MDD4811212.1 3H domain-containing protein [Methanobacterium formicicum]MDG3548580.1 3H domain-containing protein [Methanobacterium formicicum]MDH2660262.1 3H domain-containing protein [Methanobacterium formicicum]